MNSPNYKQKKQWLGNKHDDGANRHGYPVFQCSVDRTPVRTSISSRPAFYNTSCTKRHDWRHSIHMSIVSQKPKPHLLILQLPNSTQLSSAPALPFLWQSLFQSCKLSCTHPWMFQGPQHCIVGYSHLLLFYCLLLILVSNVKSSRPKWPQGKKFWPQSRPQRFGLGLKTLASASNIWPQPDLYLIVLLCNLTFFGQKLCKIPEFC